jgi:hypothetical protein
MLGGNSSTSAKALRMSATYRGTNGIGRGDVVLSRNRAYQVHSSGRASNFDHLYLLLTFEFYDLHDARCKPEAFGKLFCVRMCVWNMKTGAPGAIPTRDLSLRRRALYAAELREHRW